MEEEVMKIGRKIEKAIKDPSRSCLDMLKTLEKTDITFEVLRKTKIGVTINNYRKTQTDNEVVTLSKTLIKNWKKLLPTENGKPGGAGDSKKSATPQPDKPAQSKPVSHHIDDVGDPVRAKCREMLETSLLGDGDLPEGSGTPAILAAHIEDAIFSEFSSTDAKYKNRVRSRVANLRDKKNPALRENLLVGSLTPERLAKMSPEEMASNEMKKVREKFTKEAINDAQMAVSGGTVSDLLKCGKCGKRNCTYNQVQTRSADEPMTTFCFCNECGHRWKFC